MYLKYLIFDFETDGLGNFKTQRAIQLAWIIADENYNIIERTQYYIKGVEQINTDFHKNITLETLNKHGTDLKYVIIYFLDRVHKIINNNGKIIAHNASFDINILKNEMKHLGIPDIDLSQYVYCTKKNHCQSMQTSSKRKKLF